MRKIKSLGKKIVAFVTGTILLIAAIALIVFAITETRPPIQLETFISSYKLDAKKQVYCVENSIQTLSEYNQDKKIIPASISKLYTFDFALEKLGRGFRYTTDFYIDGEVLYLNGGGDPHFVIENLLSILKMIPPVSKLVFSPNLYFNWKQDPAEVASALRDSLKSLGYKINVNYSAVPYSGEGQHYQYQSAPLSILIKQINNYSTNTTADTLFKRAGGSIEFSKYMKNTYGAGKSKVSFGTGSGLGNNYTTCKLTLEVIKNLEKKTKDIGIENIMSIPRVDPGPLEKTLLSMEKTAGIVAKSGYLDYHRNYAGIAYTTSGPIYFAVFGTYRNLADDLKTKRFVEEFVGDILLPFIQIPFKYSPNNDREIPLNSRILKITN